MDLRTIEYIVEIANSGSFSKAAETLYISQPGLSQAVKSLEKELGVILFARKRGHVVLTHAGMLFLNDAKQILQTCGHLKKQMALINTGESGELKIGFTPLFGHFYFAKAYKAFKEKYPNINVICHEDTSATLEAKLAAGIIDCALLPLPLRNPNIQYEQIITEETFLAVPSTHEINKHIQKESDGYGRIEMAQFRDDDFIMLSPGQRLRELGYEACKAAGFEPNIAFETKYVDTANALVAAGVGISFIPYMIFASRKDNGGNEYYHINGINAERILVAAYDRSISSMAPVQAFIDTIKSINK